MRRIVERLGATAAHDVASMTAIQLDTVSGPARECLPPLLELEPVSEDERLALGLLADWDGDMAAGSVSAAVFNAWCARIAHAVLTPRLGEDLTRHYHAWREAFQCEVLPGLLRDRGAEDGWLDDDLLRAALADALEDLRAALGEDPAGWRWGALHRLRLAHPLASIPGLEPLFLAADVEFGGDEQTVMQGGFDGRDGFRPAVIPSWRAVYDLADLDRSVGVLPSGISGNPASPHWNDQTELWATAATIRSRSPRRPSRRPRSHACASSPGNIGRSCRSPRDVRRARPPGPRRTTSRPRARRSTRAAPVGTDP